MSRRQRNRTDISNTETLTLGGPKAAGLAGGNGRGKVLLGIGIVVAFVFIVVFIVWVVAWLMFWAMEEPQEEEKKNKSEARDV